jgi:hypothetical protein
MNSAGERVPFAEGDFLTRYPAGHHYELRIESPFEKPGWKPRGFSPIGQSMFPGSAIEFQGIHYEIIFQDFDAGPPKMVSYYLKRWEDRNAIRVQFHYNEQECRKLALSYRERKQTNRRTLFLSLLAPLVGTLPAEDQIRISNRYGISAKQMTTLSALVILFPAGFAMVLYLAQVLGEAPLPGPSWIKKLYPLGFYFFFESLLRMMNSMKLEEPIGSLPVSFPVLCWRAIHRSFDPSYRRMRFEKLEQTDDKHRRILSNARDEILQVSSEHYDLEVVSILPKDHWNARLGIGYNGDWYGLVGSETIRQGKSVRYRYYLKRATEGTWFAMAREYNPEEVQILYREKRRIDLKTWVDTFAPFWGLLSREDQVRLEELYDFDALKFTKITTILLGLLGSLNLLLCLINIFLRIAKPLDAWVLLPALFLTLESVSRWRDLRNGEPSGSILGNVVRPLARKLLQGP